MRGHDVYIIADVFNYGATYDMYGMKYPMSPDDHFQDLKRIICANEKKSRRVSGVPMAFLPKVKLKPQAAARQWQRSESISPANCNGVSSRTSAKSAMKANSSPASAKSRHFSAVSVSIGALFPKKAAGGSLKQKTPQLNRFLPAESRSARDAAASVIFR